MAADAASKSAPGHRRVSESDALHGARPQVRRLAILGGGKMGATFASRAVEAGVIAAQRVVISEPAEAIRSSLEARIPGVVTLFDHARAVSDASTIILAITPQIVPAVTAALRDHLQADQLVISIAAGVELQTLRDSLGHDAIVRVMPNTPAQIGQGISAWLPTSAVTAEQKVEARAILQAVGREFEVDREAYLDMVTAMSGSGPAWVMLMLESMIDAGVQIGLRPEWARELALQTMSGSVELARTTGKHPAELRNMVTTPGGTTAAGLYAMEQGGLRATIMRGIVAAYERSLQLGAAARR